MRLKETPSAASSAGPSVGARASRSPPPSSPAVSRSRLERPRDSRGQDPGEHEGTRYDREPDRRKTEPAVVHAVDDGLAGGRYAHRTDDLAPVDDRDRHEQKIASPAVSLKRRRESTRPSVEGNPELRPLRRGELRPGCRLPRAVHQQVPALVRHHDSLVHGRGGVVNRLGQRAGARVRGSLVRRRHLVGDAGGEERGPAEHVRLKIGVRPPLDAERERDLEREDDRGDEIGGREDEAGTKAHGSSSSADEKRKPTPRTVWM